MEILIERKHIPYLKCGQYQRVDVTQQGDELRVYLYSNEQEVTVFIQIEPAFEGEKNQLLQILTQ